MKYLIILSALLAGCIASDPDYIQLGGEVYQDGDTLNTKDTLINGRPYREIRVYWGGAINRSWVTDTTHNHEPIIKERRLCGRDKVCYKWPCGDRNCHKVEVK